MAEEKSDPEEEKIRQELRKNGPVQECFAGYYYDGAGEETTCTTLETKELKIDTQ